MMPDEHCSAKQVSLITLQAYCQQNIAFILQNTGKDYPEIMKRKT